MKLFYYIFLSVMLLGNFIGFVQLLLNKQSFIQKFPQVTNSTIWILQVLPLINIAGLTGMLLCKSWSPYTTIAGALLVIATDIYFKITYHLYVAIPAAVVLIFLCYYYNVYFNR